MVSLVHVVGISVCNCRRLFGATKSYELRFVFLCRRKDDTDMSDPPQKTTKKKGYAETHTGHQYKIKADLKRKLFEMFTGQGMNRKHSLDFLRYVEHDLRKLSIDLGRQHSLRVFMTKLVKWRSGLSSECLLVIACNNTLLYLCFFCCCREREKLGTVRVSTAYEFY